MIMFVIDTFRERAQARLRGGSQRDAAEKSAKEGNPSRMTADHSVCPAASWVPGQLHNK